MRLRLIKVRILFLLLLAVNLQAHPRLDTSKLFVVFIGDSHGYVWPEIAMQLPEWQGTLFFTNATHGGTIFSQHTNQFYQTILPLLPPVAENGTNVIIHFGGGTVDQISGLGMGGIGDGNYIPAYSNLFAFCESRGYIVSKSSLVPILKMSPQLADRVWKFNNWLVTSTNNHVGFIPDFFRLGSDHTDTNYWDADEIHPRMYKSYAEEFTRASFGAYKPRRYFVEPYGSAIQFRNSESQLIGQLNHNGNWDHLWVTAHANFAKPDVALSIFSMSRHPDQPAIIARGATNQNPNVPTLATEDSGGNRNFAAYHDGRVFSGGGIQVSPYLEVFLGDTVFVQVNNLSTSLGKLRLVSGNGGVYSIQDGYTGVDRLVMLPDGNVLANRITTTGTNTFNGDMSVAPQNPLIPSAWLPFTNNGVRYYLPAFQ